ncbi:MAG: DUF4129 domain-containing protein [Ferruginibacter sp.]|nr:DUF4129 domain-containing protein [Ferruginibacter sp.]
MASYLDCKTTMLKKLVVLLFLQLYIFCASAQESPVIESLQDSTFIINAEEEDDENSSGFAEDVKGDTSIIFNGLEVKKDSINFWKNKKEYSWIKNLDSFLINKKKQAEKQPKISTRENNGNSFFDAVFNSGILQTILWMAAIALLLFIIYKLFLSNAVFSKRSKKANIEIEQDEEDITLANDYDSLLRKAYNTGELKMAMRFLFLKTLQKLNDRELIRYSVDKTNSNYVKELPPAKRNLFASLALYYEYIWYGNAPVTKEIFDAIEIKFNEFLNRL